MNRWNDAVRLVGVGFFIGGSIVLGVFFGLWLDGKLGISPIMTILGFFAGLIIAGLGVYRMLISLLNNKRDRGAK